MKHAKRMVLVPEDFLSRMERQNKQETSPIVKGLTYLDENLDKTLMRTDLTDNDKQKIYHANLEQYMRLKDQKTHEGPTVNISLKHAGSMMITRLWTTKWTTPWFWIQYQKV